MKLPVTESGVNLPKAWFGSATEVEVRRENGHVEIEAVVPPSAMGGSEPYAPSDPIWNLGKRTSDLAISNASENLDHYLYGETP